MHDGEETLGHADLAAAAATSAGLFVIAFRATGAFAGFAGFHAGEFDILVDSEDGVFEVDFEVVTQIVSLLRRIGGAASSAASEKAAERIVSAAAASEEAVENIERIACAGGSASTQTVLAVTVVELAFLRVAENLVGLRDLFELFGRFRVVRILVRMIFDGKFAIGPFDFDLFRSPFNPQDFVVVRHVRSLFRRRGS